MLHDLGALADLIGEPRAAARLRYVEHEPGRSMVVVVATDDQLAAVSIGRIAAAADGPQVVRYPDDPGLPAAALGWHEAGRRLGIELDPARCERLAWVPHRRLVLGLGATVVKLHAAPGETADALVCTARAAEAVAVPRVLAADEALAIHVQERVAGRQLERVDAELALPRAAILLADLRRLDPAGLRPHPPAALLEQCRPVVGLVAFSASELAGRVEHLLATLERRLPDAGPPVAAHGDFNVGQLLDADGRLVVVDTDTLCAAPAEYDPASYAANVVSGRPDDQEAARRLAERFARDSVLDRDVLDWYLAAMVVRRLDRAIRRAKRDWPERTLRLVDAAERLLG